jgi:glycogen debranching enzyme
MALQAGGDPCAVIASNPGQALWTGIVDKAKASRLARRLMEPELFGGWGVRTLSTKETAYDPISYHRGTVWPHDNALILAGLRRYGHEAAARRIYQGIFDAATHFDHFRMPEVFCGFAAQPFGEPVRYPVACHPQAWAAGALPLMLVTMLGLEPDGFARRLRIHRPFLLDLVHDLVLEDLAVGTARVDLRFHREGERVEVEVHRRHGSLEVEILQD